MTYLHLTPWALYNEIDEYAAAWLENLIARGLIAPGIVDRRSIEDIRPDELRGFRQVHFFAGIGVWSYSLRRAGMSDDTALWTGSCPCQPFSAAGKGGGVDDERHLWPAMFHLIRERRPERVYGEQVASKDGLGWLDLVLTDMEKQDYAIGAVDTCSAGSGAPHIRQRLRFAAYDLRSSASGLQHTSRDRRIERRAESSWWGSVIGRGSDRMDHHHHQGLEGLGLGHSSQSGQRQGSLRPVATPGGIEWVASGDDDERGSDIALGKSERRAIDGWRRSAMRMADGYDHEQRERRGAGSAPSEGIWPELGGCDDFGGMGDADRNRARWDGRSLCGPINSDDRQRQSDHANPSGPVSWSRPTNGFWADADWLFCRDGKWRPVEPGTFPLAHGAPSRVGRLRAYGNAVDAEATTDFLEAYLEKDTIDIQSNAEAGDALGLPLKSTECGMFEDLLG